MIDVGASDVIAAAAVAISVIVFAVQRADRRRDRRTVERAQAEQIAGWLSLEEDEQVVVHLHNASSQPIYDLLWMARDYSDLDVVSPDSEISVLPPHKTIDLYLGPAGGDLHPHLRVYLSFRDGHGLAWQRDSHGRLTRTHRPFDDAPPTNPITGRGPQPGDPGRRPRAKLWNSNVFPRPRWPWKRRD
jgi:hypothetical protein